MSIRVSGLLAGLAVAIGVGVAAPSTASAATRYYGCAGGFVDPGVTGPFLVGLGQGVDVVVDSNNLLGLTITVSDTYSGQSQSAVLPPYGSRTFHFTKFGAEPISWSLRLSTASQSVLAGFGFRSYYCGRETGAVRSGVGGKCMDDYFSGTSDGNKVVVWSCNGTGAQSWTWGYANDFSGWDQTIRVFGKCLDVRSSGTANGTEVQLWTCNGTGAQRWVSQDGGTLKNPQSNKCLAGGAKPNGTQLEIQTCDAGKAGQRWTLPVTSTFLS